MSNGADSADFVDASADALCPKCDKLVTNADISSLSCDSCRTWFHGSCTELKKRQLEVIHQLKNCVKWFCSTCGLPSSRVMRTLCFPPDMDESSHGSTCDPVFNATQVLLSRFPDAKPDVLYNRLESAQDLKMEVAAITEELRTPVLPASLELQEDIDDISVPGPSTINSPVAFDSEPVMTALADIQIELDKADIEFDLDEILNRLSAPGVNIEHEKLEIVDEYLTLHGGSPRKKALLSNFDNGDDQPGPSWATNGTSNPTLTRDAEIANFNFLTHDQRNNFETIVGAFPNIDPDYVVEQVSQEGATVDALMNKFSDNSGYPKLKQRIQKRFVEKRRKYLLDPDQFDAAEYLLMFPDPEVFFTDVTRNVSQLYIRHATVQLENDFKNLTRDVVANRLNTNNNLFLLTRRAIQEQILDGTINANQKRGKRKRKSAVPKLRGDSDFPGEIEEIFFRELQYALYEVEIAEFIKARQVARNRVVERARTENRLIECIICCSDECLVEEMLTCQLSINIPDTDNQHRFCKDCWRSHANQLIGQGKCHVNCLNDSCESELNIKQLLRILTPQSVSLILKRLTLQNLEDAGLEGLAACPFCDYQAILPPVDVDKLFKCENPECFKESCRLCNEPSHIPLKCEEVEKNDETAMRKYIEEKMAEAMIRECPKCKKGFVY